MPPNPHSRQVTYYSARSTAPGTLVVRWRPTTAGWAVHTAEAHVGETVAGTRRAAAEAGEVADKKLSATAGVRRDNVGLIGDDLAGLRSGDADG